MRTSVRITGLLLLLVVTGAAVTWYAVSRESRRGVLTVSVLAVGQGRSVFIDAPSGRQVLIDGGPDGSVLRRLGGVMPPWDRSIDVVVATTPEKTAVNGLIDVLQRYRAGMVLQSGIESTTPEWNLFEKQAAATEIRTARRGQVIDLGKGAFLEVLFPDRVAPGVSPAEGCVVTRLVYGATAFLFACDAPAGVEQYLAMLDGTKLKSDVLFTHGEPTLVFAGPVAPRYVVYDGCETKPTGTIADELGAEVLTACDRTVTFVSDGKTVVRK